MLGDNLGPSQGEIAFELDAEFLGDVGHAGKVGGALHIKPVPQLADAHARLALGHAKLAKTRGKTGTVEPNQGLALFGSPGRGLNDKRRYRHGFQVLPGESAQPSYHAVWAGAVRKMLDIRP